MHWKLSCLFLLIAGTAMSQQHDHAPEAAKSPSKTPVLMKGLGRTHHPVSTSNAGAQRFFDQGLGLFYAFNTDEALRSFQHAAELDPQCAMAHWGMGLALGVNINRPRLSINREKAVYEAIEKAVALSPTASVPEQAYIGALSKRYSLDPAADRSKLAMDYKIAMGELMNQYPNDLDAATLYAESAMDLRPWRLWSSDGKPAEGTQEIVTVLQSVLKRDPSHVGANHFLIHAVEASPNPLQAAASAARLKTLAPAAGHLLHMPAHIYMRTGDYHSAALSNEAAADADRVYIETFKASGNYALSYYTHNLHFLAIARSMEGNFGEAMKAVNRLEAELVPNLKDAPGFFDMFMPTRELILVRFRRWNDILNLPPPDPELQLTACIWHFARGLAFAATGDVSNAQSEHRAFLAAVEAVPADASFNLNSASSVLKVAQLMLESRVALLLGEQRTAIESMRSAVKAEDALVYDEPPSWYLPSRESLGGLLMITGDYKEAEKIFRDDLQKNPRNGRSLFGLFNSLKSQGNTSAAGKGRRDFESAWKTADTKLKLEDL